MELDDNGDLVGVKGLFIGEIEFDGDAKVAADDDDRRNGEVEGENGDDERESLVFHLAPGQRAGYAERLWAITSPAQNGEHGPYDAVEPDPHAHDLHWLPGDFLLCERVKKTRQFPFSSWFFPSVSHSYIELKHDNNNKGRK